MYVHIIKAVTNGVKKCEPLNDLVEDVPVGVVIEGNRNISDSTVVAMFEANVNHTILSPHDIHISTNDTLITSMITCECNLCKCSVKYIIHYHIVIATVH